MTPTLTSLLTAAEDLSAALLRARNAAVNTPAHPALARIERAMLSVYAELVALEQADASPAANEDDCGPECSRCRRLRAAAPEPPPRHNERLEGT